MALKPYTSELNQWVTLPYWVIKNDLELLIFLLSAGVTGVHHCLVSCGPGNRTQGFLQASQALLTTELYPQPGFSILCVLQVTTSLEDLEDFVVPTLKSRVAISE